MYSSSRPYALEHPTVTPINEKYGELLPFLSIPRPMRPSWRCHRIFFFKLLLASLTLLMTCIGAVHWLRILPDTGVNDTFALNTYIPSPYDVEPLAAPFHPRVSLTSPTNSSLQSELDARLASFGLDAPSSLSCPSLDSSSPLYSRYEHLRTRGPTLIAINLFESAEVIPSLFRAILDVAAFLQSPSLLHVSVFENGSKDATQIAMAQLARALKRAGISHSLTTDSTRTNWKDVDRIEQLALYRNVVIKEVDQRRADGKPWETVVFVNDVFFCARDMLELMHQRVVQSAHATCGLDWLAKPRKFGGLVGRDGPTFYDNWVSRSISGNTLRPRSDMLTETRSGLLELFNTRSFTSLLIFNQAPSSLVPKWLQSMLAPVHNTPVLQDDPERESRERFRKGLPLAVYSCWNGMIAMDARPFISSAQEQGVVFRGADRKSGECSASECQIIAKDFWSRGFDRWVLVPSVRVTYHQTLYAHPDLVALASLSGSLPFSEPTLPSSLEIFSSSPSRTPQQVAWEEHIDWKTVPRPKEVVCFAYHGFGWQGVEFPWSGIWERATLALK